MPRSRQITIPFASRVLHSPLPDGHGSEPRAFVSANFCKLALIGVLAAGGLCVSLQASNEPKFATESVSHHSQLGNSSGWKNHGLDQRGRDRFQRAHLGSRAVRGQLLRRQDRGSDPQFDESGKLLKSFGGGLLVFPHGFAIDKQDNIWVTDSQGKDGKGHQVFKFSPDGKLLLTLGKPGGGAGGDEYFNQPNDVAIAPNGDIFVAEGHSPNSPTARVMKFTKDGKLIKQWGKPGSGKGEFIMPHSLAFDSKGRLFVADRGNNRIQIFDQDGNYLDEWKQFSRPSGLYIDAHDVLYVADSESTDKEGYGHNPGWKRGIRIGSAQDGTVKYFIPDPSPGVGDTSAAEGVAADRHGNVFGAEVKPKGIKKYVKE